VRIDVIDSGVGIGDDDRARVFDEFVQLAAAPRHHAAGRGMGLGLAIVRRLAALLGHRIELASMPGRGSRFSIVVPRAILPRQRPATPRIRDEPLASDAQALEGRCVVVVDDDPAVVGAMGALFASWKATATGGADADSALAALSAIGRGGRNGVDLIIADLRLADGRSGIDAIARLPEKQAAAVTLRVLEEQPYEAVAAALGCTEPTARVHVLRGREKLARRLGPLAPAARRGDP